MSVERRLRDPDFCRELARRHVLDPLLAKKLACDARSVSHVAKLGLARSRCAPTFSAAARSVRLFIVSRSAFSMVDAAATIWCARPAKRERWRVCGEQTQKAQGGATHHPIHAALHVRIQVLVREEELERKWLEARGGDLAHLAAPPALLTARGFQGAHRAGTLTVTEISGFQGVGRVAALWKMTWHAARAPFVSTLTTSTFALRHRRLDTTDGPDSW